MTWLERAPTILAEKGHPPRDPYPLDASEQELLFSELTADRRRSGAFEEGGGRVWWVLTDSNRRHSPCKGDPAGQSRVSVKYRICNYLFPLARD